MKLASPLREVAGDRINGGETLRACREWLLAEHQISLSLQALSMIALERRAGGGSLRLARPKCPHCGRAMPTDTTTPPPTGDAPS